jgi:hypothetical protein
MKDTAIVVTLQVTPAPGNPELAEFAGAYAVVFTTATSEDEALAIAGREMAEAGWTWQSLESVERVTRASYEEGTSGLEYFEQVLQDDVVVVLHAYSTLDEDEARH